MFRFFRSIRQQLLAENKTVKYAKYAVGEFLLIVAGILVALQIQNWNEERKLEQERRELIVNLASDFQIKLERLKDQIPAFESQLDTMQQFMERAALDDIIFSLEIIRL